MMTHAQGVEQYTIIDAYNAFINELKKIDALKDLHQALQPLSSEGVCFGLVISYGLHAFEGHRQIFSDYISFLNLLTEQENFDLIIDEFEINNSIQYQPGPSTQMLITLSNVLSFVNNIIFFQKNNKFIFPMVWEAGFTFVCHKDDLVRALSIINIKQNDIFIISKSNHVAYIEKTKEGIYLFEPNNMNIYSVEGLLQNEKDLAIQIIENTKNEITENNLVGFQLSLVTFNENHIYTKMVLDNNHLLSALEMDYAFESLNTYRMSCSDFFLLALDKIEQFNKNNPAHALLEQLQNLQNSIKYHFDSTKEIQNKLYELSKPHIDSTVTSDKFSLLFSAVAASEIRLTERILSENKSLLNLPDSEGCSPLCASIIERNYQLTKLLIDSQANVNHAKNDGDTPLHLIAANKEYPTTNYLIEEGPNNQYKMAHFLLEKKANVNLCNKTGETAFDIAVKNNHHGLVKLLQADASPAFFEKPNPRNDFQFSEDKKPNKKQKKI